MYKSGIYKILNKDNGKFYVGSAKVLLKRWNTHKIFLKNKNHPNIYLQRSSIKHGLDKFEFIVLEYVENINDLISREQFYIDSLKPEYNVLKTAGSLLGFKHSEETKNKYYRNKKDSEETKARKSLATKGKPKSELHKAKIGAGNRNQALWPHELGSLCKCDECKNTRNKVAKTYPSYAYGKKPKAHTQVPLNRNVVKWPHPSAAKCKCEDCTEKRRKIGRAYYYAKRAASNPTFSPIH